MAMPFRLVGFGKSLDRLCAFGVDLAEEAAFNLVVNDTAEEC